MIPVKLSGEMTVTLAPGSGGMQRAEATWDATCN